ncbi:MAG: M28 family peptidase, partial [Deltaproteobacteria bacterium]|nr:M28 family peptidase [Deltaproteobacteria bacterium]
MYSRLPQAIVLLIFCASCNASENKTIASNVYRITKDIVAYGPRDPGSKGLEKVRSYLRGKVAGMGFVLQEQHFKANTPLGAIEMKNLYFDIPGTTSAMILLGAHYDSKRMGDMKFIGANDAASSVALLLGLSPWIKKQRFKYTVRVVLFDGEEAIRTWSSLDSLYGSKAYVQQIGEKESVKA